MKTSGIWLEVTLSGAIFLLSVALFIMHAFDIHTLSMLSWVSGNLVVTTPLLIATSYVIGTIVHRLIPSLWFPVRLVFGKIQGRKVSAKEDLRKFRYKNLVVLYQYGSERIQREQDFQYSLLALFRSLTPGFVLLGLSFFLWARQVDQLKPHVCMGTVVCSLLAVGTFAAWLVQKRNYGFLQNAINEEMKTVKQ